jgi:hypothetical protein
LQSSGQTYEQIVLQRTFVTQAVNADLDAHKSSVASATVLGHVKVGSPTIGFNASNQLEIAAASIQPQHLSESSGLAEGTALVYTGGAWNYTFVATSANLSAHGGVKATTTSLGHVKVDGETIFIDSNGVISAQIPNVGSSDGTVTISNAITDPALVVAGQGTIVMTVGNSDAGAAILATANGGTAITGAVTSGRAFYAYRYANSGSVLPLVNIFSDDPTDTNATLSLRQRGSGDAALLHYNNSAASSSTGGNVLRLQTDGVNVARIDKSGKGLFDGGVRIQGYTQALSVTPNGTVSSYTAGDVLMIDTAGTAQFKRCNVLGTPLVAGVVTTSPGILLSDLGIDADASGKLFMATHGIMDVKVDTSTAQINIGDPLVAGATVGCAVNANLFAVNRVPCTIIGKALQARATSTTPGTIKVLVTLE